MQPQGEAQRNESYDFKVICCQRFYSFTCACDSLCFSKIHCPIIKRLQRALPGDKFDYLRIKNIEDTVNWQHKVPSLARLAYGACRSHLDYIPTPIKNFTYYKLLRQEGERKDQVHNKHWSYYAERYYKY